MRDEFHAFLYFANLFRYGRLAQLHPRAGFVNQVNRLIRQKPVGDITIRKVNGIAKRFIGISDCVELLIAFADAVNYLNGFFFIRGGNFHSLEASLERAILFHRLAVFGRSRRANALDFAAGKRRLQNIRRVQRTLRRARSYQRVQLIYKDDGILALHQFLHDGLQPFFKLSAIFCSGDNE